MARRIRFRNGEHHSVLMRPGGLPVHEVTLYLSKYRTKGKAANTIHSVCSHLGFFYRHLEEQKIDLIDRLKTGCFLSVQELDRVASVVQYRVRDLDAKDSKSTSKVISFSKIAIRKSRKVGGLLPVDVATQASRLRYIADFLKFISRYVGGALELDKRIQLKFETETVLSVFLEQIPVVSKRAKLDSRTGLDEDEQNLLIRVSAPSSVENPWSRQYVRKRNHLIVILLLATGMRRGELLGLQIGDLNSNQPKLCIFRRADSLEDPRRRQPCAKTSDREIELAPNIMKALWDYINTERRSIKAARLVPQIFVSESGQPMSLASLGKIFVQLRDACPALPRTLTSHVMRHTGKSMFAD